MGSFADSIKANIKEVKQEVNDKIVKVFKDVAYNTVYLTPSPSWNLSPRGISGNIAYYSDGLLANQWYPAENKTSEEFTRSESDHGGDSYSRLAAMNNVKTFLGKDGFLSFTNNTPYAYRVEVLGYPKGAAQNTAGFPTWNSWTGDVKPYAMVDQSLIKVKAEIG